jgi:hypothetical protein
MDSDRSVWLTCAIALIVIVVAVCLTVWHSIDVQGRVQIVCVQAGGQWQSNTCVRTGGR